jgi:hypothetical protein
MSRGYRDTQEVRVYTAICWKDTDGTPTCEEEPVFQEPIRRGETWREAIIRGIEKTLEQP